MIEFKRPGHALNHDDYVQAIGYRHEPSKYISAPIQVLLIGGRRSPDFPTKDREPQVDVRIFSQVISTARKQIEWSLRADVSV